MRFFRLPLLLVVFAVFASACSGSESDSDSIGTTSLAPTTSSTSTEPPATTAATTTTEAPPESISLDLDVVPEIADPMNTLYSWLSDDRNPEPELPEGMLSHLAGTERVRPGQDGSVNSVELDNGESIAVAKIDADVLLLVDDGTGWRIVGGALDGIAPWFGEEPRMVLVLGSDARVGQNQQRYRADSVHILTVVPSADGGAFVGFARDSWVEGPSGFDKLTHHMAGAGPEVMLEVVTDLTELPIEGYFVTGFLGFTNLMDALGPLQIDLPSTMRTGNNWTNFPAGSQSLGSTRALQLARIRKGLPRGDFDRSYNQGLILQAAMAMVQDAGIEMLPAWISVLLDSVWTDLSTEDVLTLAASAYFMDPEALTNFVLPGTVGTAGAASVVHLAPEAEDYYRDLEDGLLELEDE